MVVFQLQNNYKKNLMKKINLIGYGNWGKKIYLILKDIKNIKINILRKKDTLNRSSLDLILTNNETHYNLVKKSLTASNNVFCEKPLTTSISKALKLYNFSEINKKKIYVCDIENFKNRKIKIKKINNIIRTKHSLFKDNILWRLAYHDLSYLYKHVKFKRLTNIKIIKSESGIMNFNLIFNDVKFNFYYNLNKKTKKHFFNDTNLVSPNDYYKKMLNNLLSRKVDFIQNKEVSLFCIRIIEQILKINNKIN